MRFLAVLVLLFALSVKQALALSEATVVEHKTTQRVQVSQQAQLQQDSQHSGPKQNSPHAQLDPVISLPDLVRKTMARHFGQSDKSYNSLDELAHAFEITPNYRRPAGIFVTLSRNGKTRACWGSIDAHYPDLVTGTIFTTEEALSKEYRFKKIRADEWQLLKPQVTIVRGVQPIQSMSGQNPMQYGLMVRSATKAAVILPGEASDPHYQLVICKVKAGISSKQPCQLYRIKADVFK